MRRSISAVPKSEQEAKHKDNESKITIEVFAARLRFGVADLEMMSFPSHPIQKHGWHGIAALRLAPLSP